MAKSIYTFEFVVVCWVLLFFFPLLSSSQKVPALYIFGDSTVDAGNNNHLDSTTPKANGLPFGVDFKNTTTKGRFTNGKTIADFIALKLGLPLIPAYMDLSENEIKNTIIGINYGSGGCGILPHSSTTNCLNLDMQIDRFNETIRNYLPNAIKSLQELDLHLSNSLFFISMATNDYSQNYMQTTNPKRDNMSEDGFAKFLLEQLSVRLKRLVDLGAKKFLVNNIGNLGCNPIYSKEFKNCNDNLSKLVKLYADGLPMMLHKFQEDHKDTILSYSDNFKFLQQEKEKGVLDTKHQCAKSAEDICDQYHRDKLFHYDGVHTSEVANSLFADGCFDKSLCIPNIQQLIASRK